jgi:hypothetical protein
MQKVFAETHKRPARLAPNRCYHCHGHFGLIRHRFAFKQFCSKACLERFRNDTDRETSRRKKWTEFLTRK